MKKLSKTYSINIRDTPIKYFHQTQLMVVIMIFKQNLTLIIKKMMNKQKIKK